MKYQRGMMDEFLGFVILMVIVACLFLIVSIPACTKPSEEDITYLQENCFMSRESAETYLRNGGDLDDLDATCPDVAFEEEAPPVMTPAEMQTAIEALQRQVEGAEAATDRQSLINSSLLKDIEAVQAENKTLRSVIEELIGENIVTETAIAELQKTLETLEASKATQDAKNAALVDAMKKWLSPEPKTTSELAITQPTGNDSSEHNDTEEPEIMLEPGLYW